MVKEKISKIIWLRFKLSLCEKCHALCSKHHLFLKYFSQFLIFSKFFWGQNVRNPKPEKMVKEKISKRIWLRFKLSLCEKCHALFTKNHLFLKYFSQFLIFLKFFLAIMFVIASPKKWSKKKYQNEFG